MKDGQLIKLSNLGDVYFVYKDIILVILCWEPLSSISFIIHIFSNDKTHHFPMYIYLYLIIQVTSYGGALKYTVSYETQYSPAYVGGPDVIMRVRI